jgi:hypothetical protein
VIYIEGGSLLQRGGLLSNLPILIKVPIEYLTQEGISKETNLSLGVFLLFAEDSEIAPN